MNSKPSPAIVTQDAARRLPRWALLLLCLAYVVPGYVGREPWKNADIAAFGYMLELVAQPGWQAWLKPTVMGITADTSAVLPYWIGAWAVQIAPEWLSPAMAVRLPFVLMLVAILVATWYAVYFLARDPGAQPVAFAFGGEADAADYARALADGALLALIATLGLAQTSHETTPALGQLLFVALTFGGMASVPFHNIWAACLVLLALPGLALCGAPFTAMLYGVLCAVGLANPRIQHIQPGVRRRMLAIVCLSTALAGLIAWHLDLLRWTLDPVPFGWTEWRALGRLFLWFTWPVWPMVIWTLWRWRRQLPDIWHHRHLGLPVLIAIVPIGSTLLTRAGDRSLLLALPALAALAAFALPTFKRSAAALIDWFTVLFFSAWAITIWVVWLAMQTGFPPQPAANVARLAPGFEPLFQWPAFLAAFAGTLAWAWLARWRTGRHRTALWKSLVLPAAGATLCWLLLMTLWLPALDYARSFTAQMRGVRDIVGNARCVHVLDIGVPQLAAIRYHGGWATRATTDAHACPWLLTSTASAQDAANEAWLGDWALVGRVRRPTDDKETLLVYRRREPAAAALPGSAS